MPPSRQVVTLPRTFAGLKQTQPTVHSVTVPSAEMFPPTAALNALSAGYLRARMFTTYFEIDVGQRSSSFAQYVKSDTFFVPSAEFR
jgi:hypothetical protein